MIKRKEQESFYVDMGFRLKQIRQLRQISQNDLAGALGVVKQTIQKYESGEIRMLPEVIYKCAAIFKVSVGYFYGEEQSRQQYTRMSLMIASEVMMIPSADVQKYLYGLIKAINDNCQQSKQE